MGGIESNQSPHTDDGDEDESRVIFLADGNPDISIRKGVKKLVRKEGDIPQIRKLFPYKNITKGGTPSHLLCLYSGIWY